MLEDVDLKEILDTRAREGGEAVATALVSLAKERGGFDNITVAVATVAGPNGSS